MSRMIFLCLLCISGWSVSFCFPRQYHYMDDHMTWNEAQTYCRKNYNDLATVENSEEMDQLISLVPSRQSSVWIGLYSKINWKWSNGYNGSGSDYRSWSIRSTEPDFLSGEDLCVTKDPPGLWWDSRCTTNRQSICYNGPQQDPDFVVVSKKMSWSSAQRYCRENYADLATVRNDVENQKIASLKPNVKWAWIGLYRDPDIFWSDGSGYSFKYWRAGENLLGSMSVVCGTAYLPDSGQWRLISCESKLPFVCYSTGSKQVIKLRMKPDSPSVDLNDLAVQAGLLRELQDRLRESQKSKVTLKWREHPDGKVFHKKRESSQQKDTKKYEPWN